MKTKNGCCGGWNAVVLIVVALGCNTGVKSQPAELAVTEAPPAAETETLEDYDDPAYLEDCYGLETGDLGIEECDKWVKQAVECASNNEQGEELVAKAKQLQLVWKLDARKGGADPVQRNQLRDRCRQELQSLESTMKEQGCLEPKE